MLRVILFIATNLLVLVMMNIIMSVFNIAPYLQGTGLNYQSLLIFCLLWGSAGSLISLMMSKFMAKRFMGVQVVELNGQYGSLVRTVHTLAKKANLTKMPEVGVYQSDEINAFATGPSRNSSLVAVSSGLLNRMSEDEVEGVLAHEIAHVANGDMITMALVQGVVNAFVMFFSRIVAFAIDNALRDEEGRGGLGGFARFGVVILLDIVFGILAAPLTAWFSRWREFRADAGGAQLSSKHKMISALQALQKNLDFAEEKGASESLACMKISSNRGVAFLFRSHPPLEKRIEALSQGN
ncbi:zinc metalloprotease HtpX [Halobacteriovorax marinus]|uniref:Protease HtpX homolog n=1 Tax=Halobacteriovorax marinus TaxID=97084 RepID=A0A1Y5F361_9BACT|nr:zinc metalloprotease HtpX [Halobacteriovorax marinus]